MCWKKYFDENLLSIEKFDSCDFTKNILKEFFIQMNISVLKKIFWWKITFNWKMTRIMLLGGLCIKIHFICLSKCYMKSKKNCPQNIPKYIPPKSTFSCLKRPLPNVFSLVSFVLLCFHSWIFRVWRCSFEFHKKTSFWH